MRGDIMNASVEKITESQHIIEVGGKQVAVNNKGYLINFDDWDEDFAKTVAELEHLDLTECHWEAFNFLRDFYREYEVAPHPRAVAKAIGEKIDSWGCTSKEFENAFPLGGCELACRLAGLPFYYCHSC